MYPIMLYGEKPKQKITNSFQLFDCLATKSAFVLKLVHWCPLVLSIRRLVTRLAHFYIPALYYVVDSKKGEIEALFVAF